MENNITPENMLDMVSKQLDNPESAKQIIMMLLQDVTGLRQELAILSEYSQQLKDNINQDLEDLPQWLDRIQKTTDPQNTDMKLRTKSGIITSF